MTMVVKTEGTISNPTQATVISGAIVTSDTFAGANGEVYQRQTDCRLGGSPVLWRGFNGFSAEGIYKVQDGALQAVSNNTNFGAVGLDINLADVAVQFKITKLDAGLASDVAFFDVRRIIGSSKVYRLVFSANRLNLKFRDETSQLTDYGSASLTVGDQVLYVVKNNVHQVYINGVLKINVTSNGYVGTGYVSVSRAALETSPTWGFDDLIIYSI